jgi:hypothetical protein
MGPIENPIPRSWLMWKPCNVIHSRNLVLLVVLLEVVVE